MSTTFEQESDTRKEHGHKNNAHHFSGRNHGKFDVNVKYDIEVLIQQAMKKVGANKENDICRYLPMENGGYIHHFTMRKMKTEEPEKLAEMLYEHILEADMAPEKVRPKPRAARGSRKRRDQMVFSRQEIERMLNIARMAGDKEMVRKLTPKKDLKTLKRELVLMIREGRVDQDLWLSYVEAVTNQSVLITSAAL